MEDNQTYLVIGADEEHIAALLNRHAERYQLMQMVVVEVGGRAHCSALLINKRELPGVPVGRPVVISGRPPFGS
jgi:hypothetical protein